MNNIFYRSGPGAADYRSPGYGGRDYRNQSRYQSTYDRPQSTSEAYQPRHDRNNYQSRYDSIPRNRANDHTHPFGAASYGIYSGPRSPYQMVRDRENHSYYRKNASHPVDRDPLNPSRYDDARRSTYNSRPQQAEQPWYRSERYRDMYNERPGYRNRGYQNMYHAARDTLKNYRDGDIGLRGGPRQFQDYYYGSRGMRWGFK